MRAVFFVLLALLIIVPIGVNDVFANDGKNILEIASLEHETGRSQHHSLVQVDSDTYALAYAGKDTDGYISTFTISSDGTSIVKVNSLEHDTNQGAYNSLVQVDSDTYALAYAGKDDDGFISTFTIDSDGVITPIRIQDHTNHASASANLEHDTSRGKMNSLVQVDSDTYALAYAGEDRDGFITTFTISSDGSSITEVAGSILEHDTNRGSYNSLVHVNSDTYALAYSSWEEDGFISTFTIDNDGAVSYTHLPLPTTPYV